MVKFQQHMNESRSTSEYVKIGKLGQGAFGVAILYRRIIVCVSVMSLFCPHSQDETLVVVKEFDLCKAPEKVSIMSTYDISVCRCAGTLFVKARC
jgi:hypothetical protein